MLIQKAINYLKIKIMKFKYIILTIICCLILIITNVFATKNIEKSDVNNMFICGQNSPQWFKEEVNKIAERSSIFKPIKVFIIKHAGIEYIAIESHGKDAIDELKVFSCSGIEVATQGTIYTSIVGKYNNNEARLIWPD